MAACGLVELRWRWWKPGGGSVLESDDCARMEAAGAVAKTVVRRRVLMCIVSPCFRSLPRALASELLQCLRGIRLYHRRVGFGCGSIRGRLGSMRESRNQRSWCFVSRQVPEGIGRPAEHYNRVNEEIRRPACFHL